ncbi:putative ALA-interacting subunit 2 [Orobanche gracilis]
MEMDGRASPPAEIEANSVSLQHSRSKFLYQFTQQTLPACKHVLSPAWVISIFFVFGVIFIPVGIASLHASQSIVEIVYRYDAECVPEPFRGNKLAYIKDDLIPKNCTKHLKIPKHMKAPTYVYYQLDNYYQNHRRYAKSRDDRQLLHGLKYRDTSSCKPEDVNHNLQIVPCGLIAWSLFNDTYSFFRGINKLKVNRKDIAWKSDREHKFGKQVYPFNFQNGTLIGGATLDPDIPLSDQGDLIVWMRTSALPTFRKLYGIIEEDLIADDIISVELLNNYNTYSFSGSKKLVLSTSSWLGGRNNFLGIAYIFVGAFFLFIALVFMLLHIRNPRKIWDLR